MLHYVRELWHSDWQPLSRPSVIAWCAFYALFLLYAFGNQNGYLLIDHVNLVVHEAGHLLFGWLGPTPGLWGGTLLQLLAPLMLAAWFYAKRQPAGFAFCLFFYFENFLNIATYLADARAMALPLVSVGGGEIEAGDWTLIFESLGVLPYDMRIAGVTRALGWAGMLAVPAWLGWRLRQPQSTKLNASSPPASSPEL